MNFLRSTLFYSSVWCGQFYKANRKDGPYNKSNRIISFDVKCYCVNGHEYDYDFVLAHNHKEIIKQDII